MDTENRRGITPEFMAAVKTGLRLAGSNKDANTVAKQLWTNDKIAYRAPYASEVKTHRNPHKDGGAVDALANTVERMYRVC